MIVTDVIRTAPGGSTGCSIICLSSYGLYLKHGDTGLCSFVGPKWGGNLDLYADKHTFFQTETMEFCVKEYVTFSTSGSGGGSVVFKGNIVDESGAYLLKDGRWQLSSGEAGDEGGETTPEEKEIVIGPNPDSEANIVSIELDGSHFNEFQLSSISLLGRSNGSIPTPEPLYLSIWKNTGGSEYSLIAVSVAPMQQELNTWTKWSFNSVDLAGGRIFIAAIATPETPFAQASQLGIRVQERGVDDTCLVHGTQKPIQYHPAMIMRSGAQYAPMSHVYDTTVHITQEERRRWNEMACSSSGGGFNGGCGSDVARIDGFYNDTVLVGDGTIHTGDYPGGGSSVVIGCNNTRVRGNGCASVVIGYQASVCTSSVAIGAWTLVCSFMGVAIGNSAQVQGCNSVALGANASANGGESIAIGKDAVVSNSYTHCIAIGVDSYADGGICIGACSSAKKNSIALGCHANAPECTLAIHIGNSIEPIVFTYDDLAKLKEYCNTH